MATNKPTPPPTRGVVEHKPTKVEGGIPVPTLIKTPPPPPPKPSASDGGR